MSGESYANGRCVVLGVCGSIAVYKACELVRLLTAQGCDVRVIMTQSATELVSPRTFSTLTGNPVAVDPFHDPMPEEIEHISLADRGDAILIAPVTANTMAKLASGTCDDMLTTTVCASPAPVVLAPAMNPRMWTHPATTRNTQMLLRFGYVIVDPGIGEVACGHIGQGRLAPLEAIMAHVERALAPKPLEGVRVLVTTGATREPIDPLRYVTNRSSGKMGFALAYEAWLAGASVTCVTGAVTVEPPCGPEIVSVETAVEMHSAVMDRIGSADVYAAVAAVADFAPREVAPSKLKKAGRQELALTLVPTRDILEAVCRSPDRPRLVLGFAAETERIEERGCEKLSAKGCDLVVANKVGPGGVMGTDDTDALLIGPEGVRDRYTGHKREVARRLVLEIARHLTRA